MKHTMRRMKHCIKILKTWSTTIWKSMYCQCVCFLFIFLSLYSDDSVTPDDSVSQIGETPRMDTVVFRVPLPLNRGTGFILQIYVVFSHVHGEMHSMSTFTNCPTIKDLHVFFRNKPVMDRCKSLRQEMCNHVKPRRKEKPALFSHPAGGALGTCTTCRCCSILPTASKRPPLWIQQNWRCW